MGIRDLNNSTITFKVQNCQNIDNFNKKLKEIEKFLKKKYIKYINADISIEFREEE